MGLVHDVILPTGGSIYPATIDYSALAESGFTSTGAVATDATMALGWKPTVVDLTKSLSDPTNHYLLTIRKEGTTVTVWKQDIQVGSYTTSATTYAGLLAEALTEYAGSTAGYVSRLIVVDYATDYSTFYRQSSVVAGLFVPRVVPDGASTVLTFENALNLGEDSSGNGNDWTITGTQSDDTPTNNLPTMSLLGPGTLGTLSNGNLTHTSSTIGHVTSTVAVDSGKWYMEFEIGQNGGYGVAKAGLPSYAGWPGSKQGEYVFQADQGVLRSNGGRGVSYGKKASAGDIIGMCVDMDNYEVSYIQDGVNQGKAFDLPQDSAYVIIMGNTGSAYSVKSVNFGGSGFAYEVPDGYMAISANNMADLDTLDTAQYADIVLREGTGATANVTSLNFSPDWVNIKNRDAADGWQLTDAERGADKQLSTDSTAAEATETDLLTAFGSAGYTLGAGNEVNTLNESFLDLALKADPDAGFDIVAGISHTTGSATTFSHALGAVPTFVLLKRTDAVGDWYVYHSALGDGKYMLITSAAAATSSGYWSTVTSTQFDIPSVLATGTYIAYLFTDSDVFKTFSYTGNGSTDGPVVDLGGRPLAIPFLKNSSATSDWRNIDAVRNATNPVSGVLLPNTNAAEAVANTLSVRASGFKVISAAPTVNGSGNTLMGLAVMRQPFKYSNAF